MKLTTSRLARGLVALVVLVAAVVLVATRGPTGGDERGAAAVLIDHTGGTPAATSTPRGHKTVPSRGSHLPKITPNGASIATTTTTPTIDEGAVAALAARIDPLMAANPGCLVIEQGGTWIYDDQGNLPLTPASTQKLLLAAAALSILGPNYRFVTSVVASAPPNGGGVSDLWLVGGGDPYLATTDYATYADNQPRFAGMPFTPLASLATAVAAAGVKAVPGGLHGDDSRYDAVRTVPAWPPVFVQEHDVSPLSALTLNEGYQSWTAQTIVPADPASFAATDLSQLLAGDGVAAPVGADGPAPSTGVVIASVSSAPLSQIIGAMIRSSDNQTAELLVKELGYHQSGMGTTAAGLAAELAADRKLGLPLRGVHLIDGSGLDHDNQATCAALLAVLDASTRPRLSSLIGDLAVAGETGTLAQRYRGTPLVGTLRAKTGSIDNAGGMVGEIDLATPVRFALILNKPMNDTVLFGAEDAIVEAIAPYAAG